MDRKFLFSEYGKDFYDGMKYRCEHWRAGDYSDWKIEDGCFYYRHRGCSEWSELKLSDRMAPIQSLDLQLIQEKYELAISKMMEEVFELE
jgi:hypothetical protein